MEVALGLGLTPSSYGLFKKLRYHDVGPVPFFQKVLDARAVARAAPGAVAGRARGARPVARAGRCATRSRPRAAAGLEVERIDRRSAPSTTRCGSARAAPTRCACGATPAYLDWKYVRLPAPRATTCGRRGARASSSGFAVSRQRGLPRAAPGLDRGRVRGRGRPRREGRAALARARRLPRRGRRARAGLRHERGARATTCAGAASGRRASPMQFCVRTRVVGRAVSTDRGRWHVVFGDSDMDR